MRAQSGTFHYLDQVLNVAELQSACERVAVAVRGLDQRFSLDAIACRGNSGITVAAVVAARLGKPLCIVRKPHEQSHGHSVECAVQVLKYVIVDDFVSSGSTVEAILDAIQDLEAMEPTEPQAECVAVVTYRPSYHNVRGSVRGVPVVSA